MIGKDLGIGAYWDALAKTLAAVDLSEIEQLSQMIHDAYDAGRTVFVCGNGGSAATASHLCEDLAKGTLHEAEMLNRDDLKRLKVLSLTDNGPWITAISNDLGYEHVFVQQLIHFAQPGDLLIAISGSGNSPNIVRAVDWANAHGLQTFGMTGFEGGTLRRIATAGLHAPVDDMGLTESVHGCVIHWVVDDLLARFNHCGRHAPMARAA